MRITIIACIVVGWSAVAYGQVRPQDVTCRANESAQDCHDRIGCTAVEQLEDCQRRLLKCQPGESLDACEKRLGGNAGQQQQNNNNGNRDNGNRDNGDRGRDDRDRDRDRDRGRDDRDRDRGGDDRSRDDRGRGYRNDDGGGGGGGSRRRAAGASGGSFAANKTFGLGLELGEPTGLTGKYFVSPTGALDFGVGYVYDHYYYGDGFHLYADYLWHPTSLASTQSFELPFYIGVGGRYWNFNYCDMRVCTYGGSAIGVRVPIGIAFDFNTAPVDIFLQAVPVLDFLSGDYYTRYGDRVHFGIDASFGVRFWFK